MTRLRLPYAVECPYCAQVVHVADKAAAVDALARHILAGTDEMCAWWPDPFRQAKARLRARRERRIRRRRWDLEDVERDLGYCPHYRGVGICYQLGVCADPAGPEPQCQTCEPVGGWPSTYYIALGELTYQPTTIGGAPR